MIFGKEKPGVGKWSPRVSSIESRGPRHQAADSGPPVHGIEYKLPMSSVGRRVHAPPIVSTRPSESLAMPLLIGVHTYLEQTKLAGTWESRRVGPWERLPQRERDVGEAGGSMRFSRRMALDGGETRPIGLPHHGPDGVYTTLDLQELTYGEVVAAENHLDQLDRLSPPKVAVSSATTQTAPLPLEPQKPVVDSVTTEAAQQRGRTYVKVTIQTTKRQEQRQGRKGKEKLQQLQAGASRKREGRAAP